jgi:hypothetical protein
VKLTSALGFAAVVAVGYVAARQLMDRDDLVDRLPEPVRPPFEAVRGRLLAARQRAAAVIAEAQRERASAEAELMADYYRRVGRTDPGASGAAADGGPSRRREPVWRPNEPLR